MEYAIAVLTLGGYEWYGAHECSCVSDDELEEEEKRGLDAYDLDEVRADQRCMEY